MHLSAHMTLVQERLDLIFSLRPKSVQIASQSGGRIPQHASLDSRLSTSRQLRPKDRPRLRGWSMDDIASLWSFIISYQSVLRLPPLIVMEVINLIHNCTRATESACSDFGTSPQYVFMPILFYFFSIWSAAHIVEAIGQWRWWLSSASTELGVLTL